MAFRIFRAFRVRGILWSNMKTIQPIAPTGKTIAASTRAPARASRIVKPDQRSATGFPPSVLKVSFSVEPLVSIVSRHVKVSGKARQAITRDLTEALRHADVQLLASSGSLIGERSDQAKKADPVLTTEQAAQLVCVSRPFMANLIDSGAVELHQKVGNQRRVLRSAVVRWRADEQSRQAKSLKRLAKDLDEEIFSS